MRQAPAYSRVSVLLLGLFAALALFGVSPGDPLTFVAVPMVLLTMAAIACLIPATRATRIDPTMALRRE